MNPSDRFLELAGRLGGISFRALQHFFYLRSPLSLQNWTLNVIELLMIAAAALGLAHAINIFRRSGDSSFLGIWGAAALYCIVMEVPIYFFPAALGLADGGVIFIHNEFTAGAFYGRMPLYILALYPALLYPAYVLVRQRGLFDGRWGLIRGAVCVGFVHHCFYQVFDQLGPQLMWWLWDYQLPGIGGITLASVPLFSLVNFSLVDPIAFALLAHALLGSRRPRAVGRSVLIGVLTPALGAALSVNLLADRLFGHHRMVVAGLGWAMLAAAVLFALKAFWGNRSRPLPTDDGFATSYLPLFASIYLVTLAALWAVSLPEYLGAAGGVTARGTPIGSLPYALACAVACAWLVTPYLTRLRHNGAHAEIH
ncbi:hypothetical protein [Mycobacterium sp. TY814]|uniref:hypothetical protein n=1 Tax=unclassified Mycobacterium TaxID=2642494 RepID=UPI00274287EC|nr:hypothetical protein [Mycobacterium sp. TY814]MDP7721574.1 hypothetical protein [Mycobacterium sp. TY814]